MAVNEKTQTFPLYFLPPIHLTPGISRANVATKLYGAFIMVSLFTGMSFMNAYILEEHLGIPRGQQGTLSGDLTFWTEIISIFLMGPMGVLSDRIGRRPVFVFGLIIIGLGYGLYPFATTAGELLAYRMVYGVGLAACAAMMATISNDYPQEKSRGLLIGLTSMCNTAGTVMMSTGIARIPHLLKAQDFDPVAAGQVTFLFVTGLALTAALICQLGLKDGTPVALKDRLKTKVLVVNGLKAGKNPRIALSYASAFAARSDMVIKGMFLVLWALHDGRTQGLDSAGSMARFGLMLGLMTTVSFVISPFFGWFIDKINRVTAISIALGFASAGYLSMGIITSPLDFNMLPFFIIISLGTSFMIKASIALVGQEAPLKERGTVIAMSGMFGALGILTLSLIGGRLFDAWGPWAPFVVAGAYQTLLFVAAIMMRIFAPGPDLVGQRSLREWMSGAAFKAEPVAVAGEEVYGAGQSAATTTASASKQRQAPAE